MENQDLENASINQALLNIHEQKLNKIQERITELLALEIKNLIIKINYLITSGDIDEGIALALAANKNEYIIINERYNKNIDYDLILYDLIKQLKYLYEPTYKVQTMVVGNVNNYYRIVIVFNSSCTIL